MSRLETLLGAVRDHELIPSEEEENVSWPLQNITFSLGVHPSLTRGNQLPKVPQTLPPLPLEFLLDSPPIKDYSCNWLKADEPGFYYPWSLGDSDTIVGETLAVRSPSTDFSGKYCTPDGLGPNTPDLEQSPSSELSHVTAGLDLDLACPASDGEAEGIRESYSENAGAGDWDGVIKFAHEVSAFISESKYTDNNGVRNFDQKPDKMGEQQKREGGDRAQPCLGLQDLSKVQPCGGAPEDILIVLVNIQQNIDKLIKVVPIVASHKKNFSVHIQKQCRAAAGAVKLISQLADAAVTILPEILRQVNGFTSETCHSGNTKDRCDESSPMSPDPQVSSALREDGGMGEHLTMETLMPSLAAVSISPASLMPSRTLREDSNFVAEENPPLASEGASDLQIEIAAERASSLIADLLEPCDRITGGNGYLGAAIASNTSRQLREMEHCFEEAIKSEDASQLTSQASPIENLDDKSSSGAAEGASDEDRNPGFSSSAAAQDESDEGDTRGGDQLPLGSFALMEMDDLEILTELTHYCNICSKGFKRDANLRMHMRSHGGKYKSSIALTRSERVPKVAQEMVGGKPTRYSCPYVGCSRNVKHPKFQALKTMLCLKNHYRRSHCAKTMKCSICKSKQFSVVADLKTHEKHCGSDKWACSCGTTFSRKEKLYGHVGLFLGHEPVDASAAAGLASEVGQSAIPLQVKVTNDQNASAPQNASLDIWQGW